MLVKTGQARRHVGTRTLRRITHVLKYFRSLAEVQHTLMKSNEVPWFIEA